MRDFILSPMGVVTFIILLAIAVGAWWLKDTKLVSEPEQVYCTADAMQCPDGSYVGRSGPNCEFVCPDNSGTPAGGEGGGILPYKSGVRGIVTAGPTCPVEQYPPNPNCADKPVATNISIFRSSDITHGIAFVTSDKQGRFEISLPPGNYTVMAGSNGVPYPRCADTMVTVGPSEYADIEISCDTGIR